jgi:ABC-2 type transport system ATP-binding protein
MQNIVLQTENISKKFDNYYALDNVNITIQQGHIYALIGQNGAGKTTLIKIITGLIPNYTGNLSLFGIADKQKLQQQRRKLGQIIEMPALYPTMTAQQNLRTQQILTGKPDTYHVDKILDMVNLLYTKNKKVKDFSLGMKQRLSIAIALVAQPQLLILDEPTNGLDPQGIVDIRNLLKKLTQQHQITILLSSHLLHELQQIADCYGFIHQGKLLQQISATQLKQEFRKYIQLCTNNSQKTAQLLYEYFNITQLELCNNNKLKIFQHHIPTAHINQLLVQQGLDVHSICVQEQKLENYFINLLHKQTTL